jgi:hypothetical protein
LGDQEADKEGHLPSLGSDQRQGQGNFPVLEDRKRKLGHGGGEIYTCKSS